MKLSYEQVAKAYDATFMPLFELKIGVMAVHDHSARGSAIRREFMGEVDAEVVLNDRTFWANVGWTEHEFWTECHRRIRSSLLGVLPGNGSPGDGSLGDSSLGESFS